MAAIEQIEFLHVAALDALSRASVRAEDAVMFMGGTSLKLCYGSPRWSEDLDFLAVDGTRLDAVMDGVAKRVNDLCLARYGRAVTVHGGNPDKNPVKYELRMAGENRAEPHLRVKIEFHTASRALVDAWDRPECRISSRALPNVAPVISTASLTEIFAEKLHAIGGRRALKVRDVFDLAWMAGLDGSDRAVDRAAAYGAADAHLALYPTKAACDQAVPIGIERVRGIGAAELAAGINEFLPGHVQIDIREAERMRSACLRELEAFEAHLAAAAPAARAAGPGAR